MILLCYQEQYNWLHMLGVRHKLLQLSAWFQLNKLQIQEYIKRYPYVQFKQMEVSNIFKTKLGQIISLIITQIVPITSGTPSIEHLSRNLHQNSVAINNLCVLKKNLEQMKYAFLGLDDLKRYSIALIHTIIEEAITLTGLQTSFQPKDKKLSTFPNSAELSYPKNHKQLYQQKLLSWKQKYQNMDEKSKTQKIRAQIYAQMNDFLTKKQKDIQERRQKRIFSHRTSQKQQQLNIQLQNKKGNENKERKRIFTNKYENLTKIQRQGLPLPSKESHPKKVFKYLDDSPSTAPKTKFNQIEQKLAFESPKNYINNFLPQTSDSNDKIEHDELQKELSKFQAEKEIESSIKMQLNFDYLLNKLREQQKNEAGHQNWEIFEEDSIEKEKNHQNLEDSLEIMKAQQQLNNTAHFGSTQSKIVKEEDHQYSFSNK